VPQVAVAEPAKNADQVLELLGKGDKAGVALMVFPELCLSAYAIDDLVSRTRCSTRSRRRSNGSLAASKKLLPVFVVGAPLRWQGAVYNCGVALHRGRLLGIVPKVFLLELSRILRAAVFHLGEGSAAPDNAGRAGGAVRHRPGLRRRRSLRLHLPCRDLRGFVGAAAAEARSARRPAPRCYSTCR